MKIFTSSRKKADLVSFLHRKQEKETGLFDMDNPHTFPQGTHGCFEGVKLEGGNAGATMIARHGNPGGLQDCCSINIYISNNVQGVNNSVLIGSEVEQGDPGVRLSLKGLKLDKGFQKTSKKKNNESVAGICWMALFAVIAMIFFFSIM